MKKLTSVLLSLVMLMSVLCVSAMAAEQTDCVQTAVSVDLEAGTIAFSFTANETTTNGRIVIEFDDTLMRVEETNVAGTIADAVQSGNKLTLSYATTTADALSAGTSVATVLFTLTGESGFCHLRATLLEFNAQERLNTVLSSHKFNFSDSLGDVNGDGKTSSRDVIIVLQAIASKLTGELLYAADIDHDGKVTTRDAISILKSIAAQSPAI